MAREPARHQRACADAGKERLRAPGRAFAAWREWRRRAVHVSQRPGRARDAVHLAPQGKQQYDRVQALSGRPGERVLLDRRRFWLCVVGRHRPQGAAATRARRLCAIDADAFTGAALDSHADADTPLLMSGVSALHIVV
ncbi:hypothetical protein PSAC2689_120004 [Paraburkholderia sacchari]